MGEIQYKGFETSFGIGVGYAQVDAVVHGKVVRNSNVVCGKGLLACCPQEGPRSLSEKHPPNEFQCKDNVAEPSVCFIRPVKSLLPSKSFLLLEPFSCFRSFVDSH